MAHFFLVAAFLQFGRVNTFVLTKVLNIYKGLQYNLSLRRLADLDTEKSGHHKVGKTRHADNVFTTVQVIQQKTNVIQAKNNVKE